MHSPTFHRTVMIISIGIASIVVAMPFHAFLSVWFAQLVGHYTALRLWKEFVLIGLLATSGYLLLRHSSLRTQFIASPVVRLIFAFMGVQLLWGVIALAMHHVTLTTLGYGWIVDNRMLAFFLVTWTAGSVTRYTEQFWLRLTLIPAVIVVMIGLFQYFVLPYDFLKHFGYSAITIFPFEDINHNTHYIRVLSTLRGANPLGAYMVLVLGVIGGWMGWLRRQANPVITRNLRLLAIGCVVILVLTFSRGAWLGLVASVVFVIASHVTVVRLRTSTFVLLMAIIVFSAGIGVLVGRNTTFQNVFLHTETNSKIVATSNQGHVSALQSGIRDVVHEPLGRGPGTAGPASAYNTGHPVRIAENYFIQLAQETGWIGLGLFIAINVFVGRALWSQRHTNPLALGLVIALVGLSCVNLFSHAWADDTLAYLWWGLAGLAAAIPIVTNAKALTQFPPKR